MKKNYLIVSSLLGIAAAFAQSMPMYQFNFYTNPAGGAPQVQGPVNVPSAAVPAPQVSPDASNSQSATQAPTGTTETLPVKADEKSLTAAPANPNNNEQVVSLQNKVEELSTQVDRFERWGLTTSGIYLGSSGSKDLTENKTNSFAKFKSLELARVGIFLPLGENFSIEPGFLGGRIIAEKRGCGQKYCVSEKDTGYKQKGQIQGLDVELGARAYLPANFPLYVKLGIRPTWMKGEVSNGWDKNTTINSRGGQLAAGFGFKLGHLGLGLAFNYGVHEITYEHTSSLKVRQAVNGLEGKLSYTF